MATLEVNHPFELEGRDLTRVPHVGKQQIYIDAVNPTRTISSRQGRVLVRKLVAGLRAAGLQKGDCVCVHSFNDVSSLSSSR